MNGDNVTKIQDAADQNPAENEKRERSTIAFPYNNLADAIEVVEAIHTNVGSGDCDDVQLSAWLKQSHKSSSYRSQVSAARLFGLIEPSSPSGHHLSPIGRQIVDPQRSREAKATAFLNIPLYNAVYENHKGTVLPPPAALDKALVSLGVAEKQKERARQVLERSAEYAGFFESGRNRLVKPGFSSGTPSTPPNDGGGRIEPLPPPPPAPPPSGPTYHPFIEGLLKTLPEPETDWAANGRVKWLQTAANIFDLIYKGDGGGIKVESATAQRSPRPDNS